MSVLYIQTAPPPQVENSDAVLQEIDLLRNHFDGQTLNVVPTNNPAARYPRQLFGLHQLRKLKNLQKEASSVHIFYPVPYFFPFMHFLKKPIIYTITAGISQRAGVEGFGDFRKIRKLVVASNRDADALKKWGFRNHAIVKPGIEFNSEDISSPSNDQPFTLLLASAPWTPEQFDTKGIDLLLKSVARIPSIRLILLWRGLLEDMLQQRVHQYGVNDRVEIINEHVDVHQIQKRAHATVLISSRPEVIKTYPHSLLEALIAGRPVITSKTIPISDMITDGKYGMVLEEHSEEALVEAISKTMSNYDSLGSNVRSFPKNEFSQHAFLERYKEIYC